MLGHAFPRRLALPATCLVLALAPRPGRALWPPDPNVNVPLCTAAGDQGLPQAVVDGSGGAIVVWEDQRPTAVGYDVYARRVDATGVQQWTPDGILVCTSPMGDQRLPTIASDGAGGAFVVWQDNRIAVNGWDIYAQHVLASGSIDPAWPPDGLPICVLPTDQIAPLVIADGAGGAIMVWEDQRGNVDLRPDIYAQRVTVTGAMMWAPNGVPATAAPGLQSRYSLISDGAGGAIVAWQDNRTGQLDIAAQRLDGLSGAELWLHNGVPVCTATGDQFIPGIASDGAGGAIIAWGDRRGGDSDIYAQRVSPAGVMLWAPNGVPVCTALNDQAETSVISDGLGGAIIAWSDDRNVATIRDIYAQRLSPGARRSGPSTAWRCAPPRISRSS